MDRKNGLWCKNIVVGSRGKDVRRIKQGFVIIVFQNSRNRVKVRKGQL